MKRTQRLTPNEYAKFKELLLYEEFEELLSEDSAEHFAEEILEEMSTYLFGI